MISRQRGGGLYNLLDAIAAVFEIKNKIFTIDSSRVGKAQAFPHKIHDLRHCGLDPQSHSSRCWRERCRFTRGAAFTLAEGASHGAVSDSHRKAAFTLAEVLITLGIIGVVAAMTLPTLTTKFQQKVFETGFKKQYSVLNNTINYLQMEHGLSECYVTLYNCPTEDNPDNQCYSSASSDCAELKKQIVNKLKLKPLTTKLSYPKQNDVKAEGGQFVLDAYNYDGIVNMVSGFALPDGAIIEFVETGSGSSQPVFIIDVNGQKGPNKWGYDAFYLNLSLKNNSIRLSDEYASLANKGGRLPRTILQNEKTFKGSMTLLWK